MADLTQLLQMISGSRMMPLGRGQKTPLGFDSDYLNDERVDPSVRADAGLGALEGEDEGRLRSELKLAAYNPGATSAPQISALEKLLGGTQAKRNASPLRQQEAEVGAQRAGDLSAINAGFTGATDVEPFGGAPGGFSASASPTSPMQQREIYKRKQAEMNDSESIHGMTEAGLNFRQGRQLNSLNRQVTAQMAPAMERAETQRRAIEELIRTGNMGELKSMTGNGGFALQSRPGAPAFNQNQASGALQKEMGFVAPGNDPFEGFGHPQNPNPALEQAVRTMVSNSGLSLNAQKAIYDVLSDPEARAMTFDELVQNYEDFDQLGPESDKVAQLLLNFRGR